MRSPLEILRGWKNFGKESIEEMKKVSYPTKKETLAASAVAVITILITAIILGIVDFFLSKIFRIFF